MDNEQSDNPQPTNPLPQDFPETARHHTVHVSRPVAPNEPPIPEEVKRLHDESRRKFPNLNLSSGEFVLSAVRRHPIGIIKIWFFVALLVLVTGVMVVLASDSVEGITNSFAGNVAGSLIFVLLCVLYFIGGIASTYIYESNEFYLTNESVIQEIRLTLFSKNEQTVSLINIEDASFEQKGIIANMLNYGNIRLSTEGDETTYRFQYVANPKKEIALLNNAVEAFKNGRPVATLPNDD